MWSLYTDHQVRRLKYSRHSCQSRKKLIPDISSGHSDFVLLILDFNAKYRNWSNHKITTTEGAQLDSLLISFSMKQLIT